MLVPNPVGYQNFPYIIIESILFGVAVPLTLLCFTLLWRKWRGAISQWITLLYTITAIGLTAGNLACFGIYTFGHSSIRVVWGHSLSYEMALWFSDSFLLYRAFGIYRGQRKWLIGPAIIICGNIVYSFISLAHQSTPSQGRGLVFVPALMSLILDVLLTTMIAVRFLIFRKRARTMGAKYGKPYATLVLIFVESGALTTLAKTTALVDFECSGAFIVPFCSIAPSLIAIRVALGLDFKEYRTAVHHHPHQRSTPLSTLVGSGSGSGSGSGENTTSFENEIGAVVGGADPGSPKEEMLGEGPRGPRRLTLMGASSRSVVLDIGQKEQF